MQEGYLKNRAETLWKRAYAHQMADELDEAIEFFKRSIDTYPTAEAFTFLGLVYASQKNLEGAIAECQRAIEIDPDFGNPYNDIGVYLMQQDKLEEALPWLERAKRAARYEPRQFPFMNSARIHMKRGRWWDALREFEAAVRVAPTDTSAHQALHSLRARLN